MGGVKNYTLPRLFNACYLAIKTDVFGQFIVLFFRRESRLIYIRKLCQNYDVLVCLCTRYTYTHVLVWWWWWWCCFLSIFIFYIMFASTEVKALSWILRRCISSLSPPPPASRSSNLCRLSKIEHNFILSCNFCHTSSRSCTYLDSYLYRQGKCSNLWILGHWRI